MEPNYTGAKMKWLDYNEAVLTELEKQGGGAEAMGLRLANYEAKDAAQVIAENTYLHWIGGMTPEQSAHVILEALSIVDREKSV
jgi:hypothetical protein